MRTTLLIEKEFYKNVDAGSNEFTITLRAENFLLTGYARNIFESNTFHLDGALEQELEHFGVDPDEVRDALENGDSYVEVEMNLPMQNIKDKLDAYAKTALDLKLYTVASRLCMALETAQRVDMNTSEDFGGEWASIECDIETVDEAVNKGNQDDLDAKERYEGEQLAKQADGRLY